MIGFVVGVVFIRRNGAVVSAPDPATNAAVSHGAAAGPALQPHQLLVAFTLPAWLSFRRPVPTPAEPTLRVLPAMRENCIETPTPPTAPVPAALPTAMP